MEEDVTRAIKQLETIAIKAMKSGYLDDAAKVMHIAEEIERVDKSGVGAEAPLGDTALGERRFQRSDDAVDADADGELQQIEPRRFDHTAVNVVPLNRFRMKHDPAVGDDTPDSPLR